MKDCTKCQFIRKTSLGDPMGDSMLQCSLTNATVYPPLQEECEKGEPMDSNKKRILEKIEKHKGELVLDMFKVVKLMGFDEDEDDYYYVFNDGRNKYSSSCVGKFIPLKGLLEEGDYESLVRVFDLNDAQALGKKYFIDKIKKVVEEVKGKGEQAWSEKAKEIQKEMAEWHCSSKEIIEIFFEATYDGS